MEAKRGFRPIYHPKQLLCWLKHLACAGCCDVIEPDLSVTLDNYLVNMFIITELAYFGKSAKRLTVIGKSSYIHFLFLTQQGF